MVLDSKQTTVAYRCPECGDTVFSIVGIFSLTGDMIRVICKNCRGSVLTLTRSSDRKIRLSVPCVACPKPHNFTLGESIMFRGENEEAICLPCPYTGIDVCFIGSTEKVRDALEESDDRLYELMKEAGIPDLSSLRGSEDDYDEDECDPMLEDIVSYVLSDLREAGAIHCGCEDGKGSYSYKFYKENLVVYCDRCKCARELRMAGMEDANRFLATEEFSLK